MTDTTDVMFDKLRDAAVAHDDDWGTGIQRRPGRARVLGAAMRLIDLDFFRPGGEEYASENGTYGLATVRRDHVSMSGGQLVFAYTAKGAKHVSRQSPRNGVCAVIRSLKRRRSGGDGATSAPQRPALAWRNRADINDCLREIVDGTSPRKTSGPGMPTVLAAVGLAISAPGASGASRTRAIARVVAEVAGYLGNTPAVARVSYIDPRVVQLCEQDRTIAGTLGDLGRNCDVGELATCGRA